MAIRPDQLLEAPPRALLLHPSDDAYGSDQVFEAVVRRCLQDGMAVSVVLPGDGPLSRSCAELGVPVLRLDPVVLRRADLSEHGRARALLGLARTARQLLRAVDGQPFDVVYASCSVTLGGAVLAMRARRPLVWHVHEIHRPGPERTIFASLLRASTVIVACSAAVRRSLPAALRNKAVVVHSGVAADRLSGAGDDLLSRPLTIGCLGRLNSWKGQDVLVAAVGLAGPALRRHGATVHIVGGEYRDRDAQRVKLTNLAARLGVADLVRISGHSDDPAAVLRGWQVAVFPSTAPEPFGMALVEAMAAGCAVVASRGGGHTEIVNEGVDGVLVDAKDAERLAAALTALLDSPDLRRRLGGAAHDRAQSFALERTATSVARIIAEASARPRRGRSPDA